MLKNKIDYSPFHPDFSDNLLSKKSVLRIMDLYKSSQLIQFIKWLFVGWIFLCILALVFSVLANETNQSSSLLSQFTALFTFVSLLLLIVVVLGLILALNKFIKGKVNIFQVFASLNGWSYASLRLHLPTKFAPGINQIGYNRQFSDVISGNYSDFPFELYKYTYVTGSGKNRRVHTNLVLRTTLPKIFPQLVLDSRKNDGIISNLPLYYDDSQRIELEGDFNKTFDLYAPDGYQVPALDVFSPDFMAILIYFHSVFDLEIIGDQLYIMSKEDKYSEQVLKEMFKATEEVFKVFKIKLKSWDFEIIPKQLPVLVSSVGENAIRIGDKRVSTAIFTLPLIAGYLAFNFPWGKYAFIVFFVALIVLVFYRRFKKLSQSHMVEHKNQFKNFDENKT